MIIKKFKYFKINEHNNLKMKNLKFHIGRGGRFNNQGHMTFVNFKNIDDGCFFEDYSLSEDGKICYDNVGNELDFQINDDGTGYIDDDGEYDTTIVVKENNLNNKQINAVIDYINTQLLYSKDLIEIINLYYPEYLEYIK